MMLRRVDDIRIDVGFCWILTKESFGYDLNRATRERGERERVLFVEGEKKHEARASLLNLLFAFS